MQFIQLNILSLVLYSILLRRLKIFTIMYYLFFSCVVYILFNCVATYNFNLSGLIFFLNLKKKLITMLNDSYLNVFILIMFLIYALPSKIYNYRGFYFFLVCINLLFIFLYIDLSLNLKNSSVIFLNYFTFNDKLNNDWVIIHPIFIHLTYAYGVVLLFLYLFKSPHYFDIYSRVLTGRLVLRVFLLSLTSIVLGFFWASIETSWGGWWSWDIVEIILLLIVVNSLVYLHLYSKFVKINQLYSVLKDIILVMIIGLIIIRYDLTASIHSFNVLNQLEELGLNVVIIVVFLIISNLKSITNNRFRVDIMLIIGYNFFLNAVIYVLIFNFYFKINLSIYFKLTNVFVFHLCFIIFLSYFLEARVICFYILTLNLVYFLGFKDYLINLTMVFCILNNDKFNLKLLHGFKLVLLLLYINSNYTDLLVISNNFKNQTQFNIKYFFYNFNDLSFFNKNVINYWLEIYLGENYKTYLNIYERNIFNLFCFKKTLVTIVSCLSVTQLVLTQYLYLFLNMSALFIILLIKNFFKFSYKNKRKSKRTKKFELFFFYDF